MIFFQIARLSLILWCMIMISATESIAIRSGGLIELEHSNRDTYARVLVLAVGSFLGDATFRIVKSRKK